MSAPWITAFVAQWGLLLLLALVVLGVLRRIGPLLDRAESAIPLGPDSGLAVGSRIPPFAGRDLSGERVSSEDLLGTPAVFLFLSPSCQPCKVLASEIESSEPARPLPVPLIVITEEWPSGVEHLARNGVRVLIQDDHAISSAFQTVVTPHAFFVDTKRQIVRKSVPNTMQELLDLSETIGEPTTAQS